MPEGPEVKITVDQLNQLVAKKNLAALNINSGRYSKKVPIGYNNFIEKLPLKLEKIYCKGKFIWFEFEKGHYIFNTLGMSGGWRVKKEKHSHVTFTFENLDVYFTDMRNFGTLKFISKKSELDKKLKELGADVFSKEYTLEYVKKVLKTKRLEKKTIAEVLMNQKKFCGIGNYLKSEILYECKISPHRMLVDLSETDIKNIYTNSKKLAKDSYVSGGGSSGEFHDVENKKGSYHHQFRVYQQKKDSLGNIVKKETTKDKRTTHWVPEIQI